MDIVSEPPGADTIPRRLKPLPNFYTEPLEDGLKESPKHVKQYKEINKKHLCVTLVIIQFHFKMHGPYNIK
jgi:hypothetical protein